MRVDRLGRYSLGLSVAAEVWVIYVFLTMFGVLNVFTAVIVDLLRLCRSYCRVRNWTLLVGRSVAIVAASPRARIGVCVCVCVIMVGALRAERWMDRPSLRCCEICSFVCALHGEVLRRCSSVAGPHHEGITCRQLGRFANADPIQLRSRGG